MKSILFVCVGNCCRSQLAEGFARHLGDKFVKVASAGLYPTSSIAPETIEVMAERGIDITAQFPKLYDPLLANDFDVVVNISGFDLPSLSGPTLTEWTVDDPYREPLDVHRRVRDEIEGRVRKLLSAIESNGKITQYVSHGQRIAPEEIRRPGLWQRLAKWL